MKAKAYFLPLVLGLATLSSTVCTQGNDPVREVDWDAAAEDRLLASGQKFERAAKSQMQQQLNDLIRDEAVFTRADPTPNDEGEPVSRPNEGGTLELEPMVVEGKRVKPLPPPLRETKMQELLRTGVVWENIGSRFTQRFWMKGDRGVMFTVSW